MQLEGLTGGEDASELGRPAGVAIDEVTQIDQEALDSAVPRLGEAGRQLVEGDAGHVVHLQYRDSVDDVEDPGRGVGPGAHDLHLVTLEADRRP